MAFPASPTNNQIYKEYIYSNSMWKKLDSSKVFDIGFLYTQLPGTLSPSEMGWYGVWENVSSSYAGDFLRIEGGNALAFGVGRQNHSFESHSHDVSTQGRRGTGSNTTDPPGWSYQDTAIGVRTVTSGAASGSTSIETRPVNQTVRIWKRTS